jgi:peptidase M48-like protein
MTKWWHDERRFVLLRLTGARDLRPIPTLWLPKDRRATVVASNGLASRLTEREMSVVLAHERAHVRGHHHLLTNCSEVLGRTRATSPGAVRLLVELSADQATTHSGLASAGRNVATSTSAAFSGSSRPTLTSSPAAWSRL